MKRQPVLNLYHLKIFQVWKLKYSRFFQSFALGDIGYSIQSYAEKFGYGVVRELVGHGIGTKLHEEPQVPNFGIKGSGAIIEEGLCLAIEPMINLGGYEVFTKNDNWTIATKDGSFSAHFEHTITIEKDGPKILTKYG